MKIGFVAFIFTIFLASFTQAAESRSKVQDKYLDQVPEDLRSEEFYRARRAILNYRLGNSTCSYSVVSKSCHALTSAHCLRENLDQQKLIRWVKQGEESVKKLGWVDPENLKKAWFTLNQFAMRPSSDSKDHYLLNGKEIDMNAREWAGTKETIQSYRDNTPMLRGPVEFSQDFNFAKLVAIGNGISSLSSYGPMGPDGKPLDINQIENFLNYVHATNTEILANFALIKLAGENCACLKTGPFDGGKAVLVGFPMLSEYKIVNGWLPAQYRETSFSQGLRCNPNVQNTKDIIKSFTPLQKFMFNIIDGHALKYKERSFQVLSEKFQDKLIFHTAFSSPGASGGSLLNSNMHLSGINTAGTADGDPDGHSIALSIEHIQAQLKTMLSPEEYAEAFNCPD